MTWDAAGYQRERHIQRRSELALRVRIKSHVLLMPERETDFYFRVADNSRRAAVAGAAAELRPILSIWGHRAGNPVTQPRGRRILFAPPCATGSRRALDQPERARPASCVGTETRQEVMCRQVASPRSNPPSVREPSGYSHAIDIQRCRAVLDHFRPWSGMALNGVRFRDTGGGQIDQAFANLRRGAGSKRHDGGEYRQNHGVFDWTGRCLAAHARGARRR